MAINVLIKSAFHSGPNAYFHWLDTPDPARNYTIVGIVISYFTLILCICTYYIITLCNSIADCRALLLRRR